MQTRMNEEIYQLFLSKNICDAEELKKSLQEAASIDERLDTLLQKKGLITEEQQLIVTSEYLGFKYINIDIIGYNEMVVRRASNEFITKYSAIPLLTQLVAITTTDGSVVMEDVYTIALADPFNTESIVAVKAIFGKNADIIVANPIKIRKIQSLVYSKANVSEAIKEYKEGELINSPSANDPSIEGADIQNAPAVKLAESILREGIASGASDIHIEPYETNVRVRHRVDGILYESTSFSSSLYPALLTRFKIMSGMNIAERRIPQDGRISLRYNENDYDFRVSTLPIVNGEKISIRILDTTSFSFTREQLGFLPEENKLIDSLLEKPHGIVLLTGPTGCGKSTTLYSFIKEINKEGVNIVTVEDPVEYTIEGVNQVQVNPKTNLTFAAALRSILRQDPNVIMIGEIRDEETATIAIRFAITGHLVFSTLHTNDAPGAITRLIDLGVQPYFVNDAINGVIAQRLVRKLCSECKKAVKITPKLAREFDLPVGETIYEPVGCPACHNTGYRGRIGVHEILVLDDELKEIVSNGGSTEKVRERALEKGMLDLKSTCTKAVLRGETSIEEYKAIIFAKDKE